LPVCGDGGPGTAGGRRMTGLQIKLSPEAEKIVAGYQTLPARLVTAVVAGMKEANLFAIANIQRAHLRGKGPFPPSEHKLGVRTGRLLGSVWDTDPTPVSNTQIQSFVGSDVIYAGPHEYGGVIHHPALQLKLRHAVDKKGSLLKQRTNSNLLKFAKRGKPARESTVQGKAYDVTMPERAPFRAGLAESAPEYTRSISEKIMETFKS